MTHSPQSPNEASGAPPSTVDLQDLNLAALCEMHPLLPVDLATIMTIRAALGLQRNSHTSGRELRAKIEAENLIFSLLWPLADLDTTIQHDRKRITEDGAEAIALALASMAKSWKVVRRLQQGEYADWLLESYADGVRRLIGFEIGGTDRGSITQLLKLKLKSVAKCIDAHQRSAGVVAFKQPQAILQSER